MKAVKKYWHGGRADWKPDNWDKLSENKKRLLRIKHKAETAFDAGDIEEAKELAAKAAKIDKRQKKWKDGIDRYVAQQQAVEERHRKDKEKRGGSASMDELMAQIRAEQDRIAAASRGGDPSTAQTPTKQTPKPRASTTKKTR